MVFPQLSRSRSLSLSLSLSLYIYIYIIVFSPSVEFCPPTLVEWGLYKRVRPSVRRHNEMGSLWTQLLLQFLTEFFKTLLQVFFLLGSEDVHEVLSLSFRYFFINFFPLFGLIFFFRSDYY